MICQSCLVKMRSGTRCVACEQQAEIEKLKQRPLGDAEFVLLQQRDEAREVARGLLVVLKALKQDMPSLPIYPENYDEPYDQQINKWYHNE